MDVTITTRHCTVPASTRVRADERLRRLARYQPRLARAEVIFETDHGVRHVEARLFVAGGPTTVAEAHGDTFRGALDRVVDRLRRQLKRQRERRRAHQAVKGVELFSKAGGA